MHRGSCQCTALDHACRRVVLTGGPGAGKTAVLEVVRRHFCAHVAVLPEAASVVFGGGFPRAEGVPARKAAQRAIYRVQLELERMVLEERVAAVALCDRGTLDGLAYWPGPPEELFGDVATDLGAELSRYATVIHLRTPPTERGYDHRNPLRVESASEAARLDERIAAAWSRHPRRFFVESADDFLDKLAAAVSLIRNEVPPCCQRHAVPEIARRMLRGSPTGPSST
jgi:predicted ATPase